MTVIIFILFIFNQIEILLKVEKDTFLVGEPIILTEFIINKTTKVETVSYFLPNNLTITTSNGETLFQCLYPSFGITQFEVLPQDTFSTEERWNAVAGFYKKGTSPGEWPPDVYTIQACEKCRGKKFCTKIMVVVKEPVGEEKKAHELWKNTKSLLDSLRKNKIIKGVDEAIPYYTKVIEKYPNTLYAQIAFSVVINCLYITHRYEEAVQTSKEVILKYQNSYLLSGIIDDLIMILKAQNKFQEVENELKNLMLQCREPYAKKMIQKKLDDWVAGNYGSSKSLTEDIDKRINNFLQKYRPVPRPPKKKK